MDKSTPEILIAAELIRAADALLITAGAGMGVDSGLPDFRGPQGFWGVYPALGRARLNFEDIANPHAFQKHPKLAWGFYGHRLNLYRSTPPGKSFELLMRMAEEIPYGAFVLTSNVDGHFQKAGFSANRICEIHGSIHHLQCLNGCREHIWSASHFNPQVDEENCLITNDMPHCPNCGGIARPNILMFGDWGWQDQRQRQQMEALRDWLEKTKNLVTIEIGAGTAIPTVRRIGESQGFPLIRINRQESEVTRQGDVGLPMGGLEALEKIAGALGLADTAAQSTIQS
jgi:NAD-dependent SIR2 family protein deacetylase